MPAFEGRFVSIVLLGRQNPRILNHDFLTRNEILPAEMPPFPDLLKRKAEEQFTSFVSLPVLSTITYGPVSITVEENRFQIRDDRYGDPSSSPIVPIVRNYFGKCLRYTPFDLGGINVNGVVQFADADDEKAFDESLGICTETIAGLAESVEARSSLFFGAPWHNGTMEFRIVKHKASTGRAEANFNYEFGYEDIDSFLANLDDIQLVRARFESILKQLGVEVDK